MQELVLPEAHALSREEIDRLADDIAVTAAHVDAATHELLGQIGRFDVAGGWAWQGARSMANWLSWRIGVGLGAAREQVRVARALRGLSLIDGALRRGELSYAKVRAMTRVATPENEEHLLVFAQHSTGAQLERICRGFRQVTRTRARVDDDERWVRRRHLPSGMVRIEAQLLPDEAERVMAALAEARNAARPPRDVSAETSPEPEQRVSAETSPEPEQRVSAEASPEPEQRVSADSVETPHAPTLADGLVLVAESFFANGPAARSGGARTQLFVHLSEDRLGEGAAPESGARFRAILPDGSSLSGQTLLRLACDAGLVVAKVDAGGSVLDVGRKRRTISPAIERALWIRDGGCRFPGCGARVYCDAHHIEHWSLGGPTALFNICLLCHHHHTLVHERGFRIERGADGAFVFLDPNGRAIEAVPRPPRGAPHELRLGNVARGVNIEPRTNLSRWDGAPLSRDTLGSCVSVLIA